MSKKLPLTVIIITNRLDQRFDQALKSVNFADEILVKQELDINDFSAIKNKFLTTARHEWVLFLDSDEIISPELAQEIQQAILQNKNVGYFIPRVDYFFGQPLHYGEVGNIKILRLAKKEAVTFINPVHEVARVKGRTRQLKHPICHYSHQSITDFYQKIIKYAYISAEHRFKNQQQFSWWEMISFPIAKFVWNYCFKLGFLDGMRGLVYALMMSLHSFTVRVRLYELSTQTNEKN